MNTCCVNKLGACVQIPQHAEKAELNYTSICIHCIMGVEDKGFQVSFSQRAKSRFSGRQSLKGIRQEVVEWDT